MAFPSYGREILHSLAEIYPQLYLTPGGESPEAYRRIVQYGEGASNCSLEHFHSAEDRADTLQALAGKIDGTMRHFDTILLISGIDPYALAIRLEEEIGCWT